MFNLKRPINYRIISLETTVQTPKAFSRGIVWRHFSAISNLIITYVSLLGVGGCRCHIPKLEHMERSETLQDYSILKSVIISLLNKLTWMSATTCQATRFQNPQYETSPLWNLRATFRFVILTMVLLAILVVCDVTAFSMVNMHISQKSGFTETSINIYNSTRRNVLETLNLKFYFTLKWCWQQCVWCETPHFCPSCFSLNNDNSDMSKVAAALTECTELLLRPKTKNVKNDEVCRSKWMFLGLKIVEWIQLAQGSVNW